MKYTKKHIGEVERRLQDYEEVLAGGRFKRLQGCGICETVPNPGCSECLFSASNDDDCFGPRGTGSGCRTKHEQRTQYNHLLSQLDKNGYQFKAVK